MRFKKMPFTFCFLAFCLLSFQISAQEKIALIVAIGDYPAGSGWMKINSQNDVPIIKSALLKQGFPEKNVAVLADEKATKKGILAAIKKELVDRASSGGVAYFHYSGHGQQVADNNNDEIDGYDEALVPFDSPMQYVAGIYEGKNLLRDEELGEAFNELRAKLGPTGNLLAVIDACHSGTGTRGMAPARGTDVIMASEEYKMTKRGAGANDQNGTESSGETTALAPLTAFFGAAPNQLNFETKDADGNRVGSLSYAFSKTFAKAEKNATYRGLFEQIKLEMSAFAPRQQPQAEGALDRQILGGKIVGKAAHFSIINWNDPNTVLIDAGWLQGINEGSKTGLYASETRDYKNAKPLAEGIVERSRPLQSVVFLEQEVAQKAAAEAWAYVLEKSYGNLSVTFKNEL
ncbi:MAG TPA: caspase family protein, partial [Bacteroidetes bacterium]|nr:caspase family protein [Bacteroidota bacterium]